ncbi:DNA endonuclease SmrA, partial [Enterobacter mori]
HPNVVRSYLARWLTEFEEVQAFCVALPHHGRTRACYFLHRKNQQSKNENWVRHANRTPQP